MKLAICGNENQPLDSVMLYMAPMFAAVTLSVVLMWVVILVGGGYGLRRWLQTTDDEPGRLILKLVTTVVLGLLSVVVLVKLGPLHGLSATLVSCLIIGVMWAPNMGGTVAEWLGGFYTGGKAEVEAAPIYSYATAKLNRGDVRGAIAEIQMQLERFPDDYQGLMMLARVHVERENRLADAEEILERVGSDERYGANQQASAWMQLADWRLKYGLNSAGAKEALEQVERRFPGTEAGFIAVQRLAHLAPQELVDERSQNRVVEAVVGPVDLGLRKPTGLAAAPGPDPAQAAAELVEHLQIHPQDFEARMRLAGIYCDHYGRADLAIDQLEQLTNLAEQPAKNVVASLNRIADIQIELLTDVDAAKKTLGRIAERYPESAAAATAMSRIQYLGLEAKGRRAGGLLKIGTYEQNIGLNGNRPRAQG